MKTRYCQTFLLIVFAVCYFNAYSQGDSLKIDSLEKALVTQKEDTNKVNTLTKIAEELYLAGDSRSALSNANQAASLSKKINFKRGEAYSYLLIAECNEDNLHKSLKNTYEALKIYTATGDKYGIAQSHHSLGDVYFRQGNDLEALNNIEIALKYYEEIGAPINIAQCYNYIGKVYFRQKKQAKALEKYFAALKIFQTPEMPKWALAVTYGNVAETYQAQGDSFAIAGDRQNAMNMYLKALENNLISLANYRAMNMTGSVAAVYQSIGDNYTRLNGISSARNYLQKSLQVAIQLGDKQLLSDVYKSLSALDSIQGNYKEAYKHYKLQVLYRDSITNEESNKKFVQVEMQNEFDKKEALSKALQDKKEAAAERIKNRQYVTIAVLGIIVLAVIIIAVIQFRNNKQKQQANIALRQQKEKVEDTLTKLKTTQAQLIQAEKMASLGELTAGIAHEIQNPLNFVNNFSETNAELLDELQQANKAGNLTEAEQLITDIRENEQKISHHGKRADSIVKSMLQHSRVSTGKKELTDINTLCEEYLRLSHQAMRSKDKAFSVELKTTFDKSIGAANVVPQDLGRVLLNLFNNAFYAVNEKKKNLDGAFEPVVSVSTKQLDEKIEIIVKDNGTGISQDKMNKIFQPFFTTKPTGEGTGLGLSLSYDIITKGHSGTLSVQSTEGEGSAFIIQLPFNQTL